MFKVQFDTSALRGLSEAAKKAVEEVVKNSSFKNELAQAVVDDIRGVTRSGKSVVTGKKLKPLTERWIETREKIISFQGAPSFVTPRKSNISLSGQLLDSLGYKIRGDGVSSFEVIYLFTGSRKPYRYQGTTKIVTLRSRVTNDELSKILDEKYQFIGIRDKLQSQLVKRLVDYYRVTISKLTRRR